MAIAGRKAPPDVTAPAVATYARLRTLPVLGGAGTESLAQFRGRVVILIDPEGRVVAISRRLATQQFLDDAIAKAGQPDPGRS